MNMRVALLAAAALAGCSPGTDAPARPPLEGARIGAPFALTDQDGRPRTDRDFAGKWRVMYFGYTFCPDVCPVDVQKVGAGLKLVEQDDAAKGAKVVPVFVTVDPTRDTPPVLKQFTSAFHPRMVGLTGPPSAIAALAKGYGVYFKLHPPGPGGGYLVDHSRQAYLMDPAGKPIALLPTDKTPRDVADEIERWVT